MENPDTLKKVSIVVPVYKSEAYIDHCIQSLITQTYRQIEVVLVNDGSPDNCGEICDRYSHEYPNIVKVIHQENQGVSSARNAGLAIATGEWIMFVDSDDWVESVMVECMIEKAEADFAEICVCGHSSDYPGHCIQHNLIKLSQHTLNTNEKNRIIKKLLLSTEWIGGYGEKADLAGPWAKLYRRSLLVSNNLQFQRGVVLSEDILFNLYAIQMSSNITFCKGVFYHHRMYQTSVTKRYQSRAFSSADLFIDSIKAFSNRFYPKHEASTIYHVAAVYIMFNAITLTYRVQDSPYTLVQKLKGIKEMKKQDIYRDIIKNTEIRHLPTGDKTRLLLIRYTPVWFFYFNTKLLQWIRNGEI